MIENGQDPNVTTPKRRRFLRAIGGGAAVFGGASGLAAAADGGDDPDGEIEVVDTEPLPDDRASEEFDVAMANDRAAELVDFMGEGDLELREGKVSADALVTDSDAFNERDPVVVEAPYEVPAGPEYGYGIYSVLVLDDDAGERVSGAGTGFAVEQPDGEYSLGRYAMDGDTPTVTGEATIETIDASGWYDPDSLTYAGPLLPGTYFYVEDGTWYKETCVTYICKYDPKPTTDNHVWCCCSCTVTEVPGGFQLTG